MGSCLKNNCRVFRVGPRGSLNAFFFFFFPLELFLISQILIMVREKGGTSTLAEHSTTESCMLCWGRINHSRKGIY
ncbi:hypothetical protein ES288_A11G272900v1 [Gossypium darwinii]|uniref:Uncharacterized protein n=1 Tax=Gossypium darwinii TaxID=34276 RepID=A0A5D2EQV3_GOSDA|nr:hypothetical protein ES288_A11G272900v1 [Gossypium darwinii]